jgi:hypothetical protein
MATWQQKSMQRELQRKAVLKRALPPTPPKYDDNKRQLARVADWRPRRWKGAKAGVMSMDKRAAVAARNEKFNQFKQLVETT